MSHELRTPMNGIIGISDLLLMTARDDSQREYAGIIRTSGQALLTILNDILDFSKIESGQMKMECIPFDLSRLLCHSVELFALTAEQKGLAISLDVSPEVPARVLGDPGRLRQVLVNLIGNAMKFTTHGGVNVSCQIVSMSADEAILRLDVADTGVGISPAVLDTLFQPFTQADDSTTRIYGGTGLGLAITKQLVELMGGQVSAASTPGVGSTFSFTVKLLRDMAVPSPEARRSQEPQKNRGSGHILVAEDNAINQRVITHLLNHLGYSVDLVSNGIEALNAAAIGCYDAILMDCQMPEMSGYEAARRIRQQTKSGAGPPIIALTASAMMEDRQLCAESGMDGYISKPAQIDTLSQVLNKWVGGDPNPSTSPSTSPDT